MSWWSKYSLSQMEEMMDFLFQQSQGGGSSASLIHQASVTLTHGQLTTPNTYEFVGAKPGCVVLPTVGTVLTHIVTAYTFGGTDADPIIIDGFGNLVFLFDAEIFKNIGDYLAWAPMAFVTGTESSDWDTLDSLQGQALVIDNGGKSGGHADNTAKFGAEFRVYDPSTGLFLTTTESGWDEDTRTFQ